MNFEGDGSYVGDGGSSLQALYMRYQWKELRNCPGRYVSSDRALRLVSAEKLAAETLGREGCIQSYQLPGRDNILVAPLDGGGGVLTYEKQSGADGLPVYVHTLNTESGLIRKIDALGIQLTLPPGPRARRLKAILGILGYLTDLEKNHSAYSLVRAFSRLS